MATLSGKGPQTKLEVETEEFTAEERESNQKALNTLWARTVEIGISLGIPLYDDINGFSAFIYDSAMKQVVCLDVSDIIWYSHERNYDLVRTVRLFFPNNTFAAFDIRFETFPWNPTCAAPELIEFIHGEFRNETASLFNGERELLRPKLSDMIDKKNTINSQHWNGTCLTSTGDSIYMRQKPSLVMGVARLREAIKGEPFHFEEHSAARYSDLSLIRFYLRQQFPEYEVVVDPDTNRVILAPNIEVRVVNESDMVRLTHAISLDFQTVRSEALAWGSKMKLQHRTAYNIMLELNRVVERFLVAARDH